MTSLKYVSEEAPEYHIIAAGSLLGAALNREKYSFPVGKVDLLHLYPLDFEEFLWATGDRQLTELIKQSYEGFTPLSLHETAMDLYKIYLMPLCAYADNSAFKVYMMDTGLLCSKFDIAPGVVINAPASFDGFKGALAENYIMQALVVNGFSPYYWSSAGKAELDFVFQDQQGNVIPLEAKSSDENGVKRIPLYAMFCLKP